MFRQCQCLKLYPVLKYASFADSIQRAITRSPKAAKTKTFGKKKAHSAAIISMFTYPFGAAANNQSSGSNDEIQSYKDIISKQDNELKNLKAQIAQLQGQVQTLVSPKGFESQNASSAKSCTPLTTCHDYRLLKSRLSKMKRENWRTSILESKRDLPL